MKKAITAFTILFLANLVLAQKPHYDYPFSESYQPLTIRANVVLLKKDDGTGNFNLNNLEEKEVLEGFLNVVNTTYSNLVQPKDLTGCYSGFDFYPDAKIRFKFNFVEVKNTYYWNYLNSGADIKKKKLGGFSPTENWYITPLDDSIANDPNIPKGINIYLTSDGEIHDEYIRTKGKSPVLTGTNAAGQFPTNANLNRSSQVHLPLRYLKYYLHKYVAPKEHSTDWKTTKNWHFNDGKGLAHELGHDLGLAHSNEYHGSNKCKYSVMKQSGVRNYLQPTEIKKIHYNLTRTNLIQFVEPSAHYGVVQKIYTNTEWNEKRRFYSDFELNKNVTLTITESVILPPQAKIILDKNSKIIFKGNGQLIDANGKEFTHFQKHRTAKIIKK